jgi:hypothetical protein
MSLFNDLADLMPDTVEIAPRTGESEGTPTYGSYVTYTPCQVTEGPIRYRDRNGDLIDGIGQIILASAPEVLADSLVKLSGGRLVSVGAVTAYHDEDGSAVQLVYLR